MELTTLLKEINRAKASDLVGIYGPGAIDIKTSLKAVPLETLEDLHQLPFWEELVEWATEQVEKKTIARRERDAAILEKQLQNRARYLFEPVLKYYERKQSQGRRFTYDPELRSGGILPLTLQYLGLSQEQPWSIQVMNELPPTLGAKHEPISEEEWEIVLDQNWVVSGQRVAWAPEAWDWVERMFPMAVDARPYNHSLNAPTYITLHDVEVEFRDIKTVFGITAGTDGSGRIHPDHELYKQLDRPGGACVVQFRAFNAKGAFAKGILVPDERAVDEHGEPTIWLDWMQMKGAHKQTAKTLRKQDYVHKTTMHLGVIRLWAKSSTFNWGFEVIENIKKTKRTQEIMREFVDESFADLMKGGLNRILARIAAEDPKMDMMIKFIMLLKLLGVEFSPLQVNTIKQAVDAKVEKFIYSIKQGAGKQSPQMVVVHDNGVAPGSVVCGRYRPGETVGIFRFPMILPQGLGVYKVQKPLPHHLVDGKVVPHAVFMNPYDVFARHQGDDDGDAVGVDNDPRVVELFRERLDNDICLIEPEATKFDLRTNSEEGRAYIRSNPMGPVGLFTIWRSRLLAVGDYDGARAMSLFIQEAVDSAKKKVAYSDYRKAVDPCNWEEDPDGNLVFNMKLPQHLLENGELPLKKMRWWVIDRLRAKGLIWTQTLKQNPIAWRLKEKRQNPNTWRSMIEESNGWGGGNLVHYVSDYGLQVYNNLGEKFWNPTLPTLHLQDQLREVLVARGMSLYRTNPSWEWYQRDLRIRSGLRGLNQALAKIEGANMPDEDRQASLGSAFDNFHTTIASAELTIQDQVDIWWHETGPNGNLNNAFRACAWVGSPILRALGISWGDDCEFLDARKVNAIVESCVGNDKPFARLIEIIYNSTTHEQHVRDESGKGIPGYECTHCKDRLIGAVIKRIRGDKEHIQQKYMRNLVTRLNNSDKWNQVAPLFRTEGREPPLLQEEVW